ncbi:hypothetical protein [Chitinophaga rupis]|nr:hypothetical protein [Chitinophaga rupis]
MKENNNNTLGLNFTQWLWQQPGNRKLLLLSIAIIIAQFIIFKLLYPYPNFLPDSYSYLDAAFYNKQINIWPIGYSKFLRLFSCITHSDTALICFQFIFLHFSVLFFAFSIGYIISISRLTLYIIILSQLLNPLSLYLSNFISSDAIFTGLSLIWFTQMAWIIHRPTNRLIAAHIAVLLAVFMFRYNALYYPIISITTITLSGLRFQQKILGIGALIIFMGIFVFLTIQGYRDTTGRNQFSAFGGWQLSSNALFAYSRLPKDSNETIPLKYQKLQQIVDKHIDSLRTIKNRPDNELGIYYLWDEHAPLKAYMNLVYQRDSTTDGFKRWASMAPLYSDYGKLLILNHPLAFTRYFIGPNLVNYYVPNAEFLALYNMGSDTIEDIAKVWFQYKSNKVVSITQKNRIKVMEYFPVFVAITNLLFLLSFIGFILLNNVQAINTQLKQLLLLTIFVWLFNIGFSVLAAPIVLRYQVFPTILAFSFLVILLSYIVREALISGNRVNEIENCPQG